MPRAAKPRAATSGAAVVLPVAGRPIDLPAPAGGTQRDRMLLGLLVLAIGSVWLGLPLLALLSGAPPPLPGLGPVGSCGLMAVGVGHLLWGLDLLLRRRTLTIEQSTVLVAMRSLTGVRRWREPLANYRGVRHRRQRVYHRYGWRVVHLLELAHADRTKVIGLLSTRDEALAEASARGWAKALRLPLLTACLAAAPRAAPEPRTGRIEPQGLSSR
jgi:hypothetical protein